MNILLKMAQIGWRGHRHLLSIDNFSREEIETLFNATNILHQYSNEGTQLALLKGFILKPVFFEPSSRTQNSFEVAMLAMGGGVLSPHSTSTSSMEKGESEEDTISTYAQYSDFLIIRHPQKDSVRKFATLLDGQINKVKVINAGDGSNEHPTQSLLDLYTIFKRFGTLDDLTFLVIGDLKYGRTVHSLILGARKFNGIRLVGFPVGDLKLPEILRKNDYSEFDINQLSKFVKGIDPNSKVVIYATRVQWERIAKKIHKDFDKVDSNTKKQIRRKVVGQFNYKISKELLDNSPSQTILLHPLPKGDEIDDELFYLNHSKVVLIEQMRYGLSVRMAILGLFAGKEEEIRSLPRYA